MVRAVHLGREAGRAKNYGTEERRKEINSSGESVDWEEAGGPARPSLRARRWFAAVLPNSISSKTPCRPGPRVLPETGQKCGYQVFPPKPRRPAASKPG